MKKENIFTLETNFLENKHLNFDVVSVDIYNDDEEEWYPIINNSMIAYENVLIKITNHIQKKEYYSFLYNTSIIVQDEKITINSNNYKNVYKKVKTKDEEIKNKLKAINSGINYLEAEQTIGLDLEDFIDLQSLYSERYKQKLIHRFNLRNGSEYEKEV